MSEQHPRAKAKHIDEGPWTVQDTDMGYEIWSKKGWLVAHKLNEPHAELFREAGNVANRTGYTPEEMEGLLLECIQHVRISASDERWQHLERTQWRFQGVCQKTDILLKKLEAFKNDQTRV